MSYYETEEERSWVFNTTANPDSIDQLAEAQNELAVMNYDAKNVGNTFMESSKTMYQLIAARGGVMQMVNSMHTIGYEIQGLRGPLDVIRNTIMVNYGLMTLYEIVTSVRKSELIKNSMAATAETLAMAIAQQWHNIAIASAATASIMASFYVGQQFGSGEWNINGSIDTPQDRRAVISKMPGAM